MAKITKRKDGRYLINVYVGSVDGKAKYKSVYGKTPVEVRNKAALIRVEYNKGIDILSGDNSTFNFWADMWLKKMEPLSTYEWFKVLSVRTEFWKKALNNLPINKISTIDCENILNNLKRHNPNNHNRIPSNKTIAEYANIITRIFDFCVQNQVLTFNPAKYITKPKGSKKNIREPLTDEQIKYFVNTPHKLQTACMIMIFAGLRKGEVLALKWEDINFENKTITVNKALNYRNSKIVKNPKTVSGNRQVPIPDNLILFLKPLNNNKGLIFTDENKNALSQSKWNTLFNNYLKEIQIKYNDMNFKTSAHCLRHTYCTLLYEAGVDVLTAKKYMGHSDLQTTLKIYTHLRDTHEQKSIEKLNNYINNI
ncbi:MAG: tyrosine-type recombinase/integrase [Candidatus Fimenecus sp.]